MAVKVANCVFRDEIAKCSVGKHVRTFYTFRQNFEHVN